MKNLMLIAGCSHASGSEIDGNEDSKYNREHSFGNLVSYKLGYTPINIASGAATNSTISRNIIEWIDENYNTGEMNLRVLVAWTEPTRSEAPSYRPPIPYQRDFATWKSASDEDFLRINLGYEGSTDDEKFIIARYHRFIAENLVFFEIATLQLILQIQYYLKMKQINYLMCNTMPMFTGSRFIDHYLHKVDTEKYLHFNNDDEAFFWKYRNAGHINPKAKYWHHGEEPHILFANEIQNKWTY